MSLTEVSFEGWSEGKPSIVAKTLEKNNHNSELFSCW